MAGNMMMAWRCLGWLSGILACSALELEPCIDTSLRCRARTVSSCIGFATSTLLVQKKINWVEGQRQNRLCGHVPNRHMTVRKSSSPLLQLHAQMDPKRKSEGIGTREVGGSINWDVIQTQFALFSKMALPYFKEEKSARVLLAIVIAFTLLNSGVSRGAEALAAALAVCLVIAVVAMVGVTVMRPRTAPTELSGFTDPVSRGVYGPWHPVIRQQANQDFLRHHVFAGGLDSSVARARSRSASFDSRLSNAKV